MFAFFPVLRLRVLIVAGLIAATSLLFAGSSMSARAQTNFGSVKIGSSATITVSVQIAVAGTPSNIAVVTQGAPNLDFTAASGGSCSTSISYAANATCTVSATFTPNFPGTRSGAVVLSNATGVIGTAFLQGNGVGPLATFMPAVLPSAQSTYNLGGSVGLSGIAVDGFGNIYESYLAATYSASGNNTIAAWQYEQNANNTCFNSSATGIPIGNSLSSPNGVAVDGAGNVYIADSGNKRVVKETLSGCTYTQSVVASGFVNPLGVAVDSGGNVYVADYQGAAVYKETPSNGSYTQSTVVKGSYAPIGVAVDASGNVYFAEGGESIFKETPLNGNYTESQIASGFKYATGVAVDGVGDVYVADMGYPNQEVNGALYKEALLNGVYTQTKLQTDPEFQGWGYNPAAVAVDANGRVFASTSYEPFVVDTTTPLALSFASTYYGQPSSDSPQTVTVSNIGNAPLTFSSINYPADFPEAAGVKTDCSTSTPIPAGASCTLSIDFVPSEPLIDHPSGLPSENVTIYTNSLNTSATQQTFTVSGGQINPTAAVTIATSNGSTTNTTPVTITISVAGLPGWPTPTGQINVSEDPTGAFSSIVHLNSNGQVIGTTNSLPVGSYTISLYYFGDSNYIGGIYSYTFDVVGTVGVQPFGNTNIGPVGLGSSSNAIPLTINFTQAETLAGISVLTEGSPNLDFTNAGGGSCTIGAQYATNASCTVNVIFTPLHPGVRTGAVVLTGSGVGVIGTGYLQGTGSGPVISLLSSNPSTVYSSSTFLGASSMLTDGLGDLYLSSDQLYEEIPSGSGYIQSVVSNKTSAGNSMAMDAAGNFYILGMNESGNYFVKLGSRPYGNFIWTPFSNCCFSTDNVAVDGSGNVYMTDAGGQLIDWGGTVPPALYKDSLSNGGYSQSTVASSWPYTLSMAVDGSGNIYAAEAGTYLRGPNTGNGLVVKETLQSDGSYIESQIGSGWQWPESIVVDRAGRVFIANDQYYWGEEGINGPTYAYYFVWMGTPQPDGTYVWTKLSQGTETVSAIAVDDNENVYLARTVTSGVWPNDWSSIQVINNLAAQPLSFATANEGGTSSSNPVTVTVTNPGSTAMTFSAISYPADFPEANGVKGDCAVSAPLAGGQSCTLSIDFSPVTSLGSNTSQVLTESVTISTNTPEAGTSTQTIAVTGTEIQPIAAKPTFLPAGATYSSAQSVTILDTTPGAAIYYTTDGITTPSTSSTPYNSSKPITVSSTQTIQAIAVAPGYINSSVAAATYTIILPNPAPVLSGISPGFVSAGGATFPLTVTGSGFVSNSTVYWGTTALTTTYGSATQLSAQVPATDIVSAGITTITVQTPAPGGGTSNTLQFEVDSIGSGSTPPNFTTLTATVTAGSPANYSVTLPSTVQSAYVTCLNLSIGAVCSYSESTNTLTITTSSTTPKGTYQITVVFTETVSGAATSYILLPILLLPLVYLRRKLAARGVWVTACMGLVLLIAAAYTAGCGGGGGGSNSPPPPQTHQVVSSGSVSITIQ
jgi:hypothetical protein